MKAVYVRFYGSLIIFTLHVLISKCKANEKRKITAIYVPSVHLIAYARNLTSPLQCVK